MIICDIIWLAVANLDSFMKGVRHYAFTMVRARIRASLFLRFPAFRVPNRAVKQTGIPAFGLTKQVADGLVGMQEVVQRAVFGAV